MSKLFYDIEKDGITQGLLSTWRECRQRADWFLLGWSQKGISMGLTYGNIVHAVLELVYKDIQSKKLSSVPSLKQIKNYCLKIEKIWHSDNPKADARTIEFKELAFLIAEATLPVYFEFWRKDIKEIKWIGLESQFGLPFTLPDGRKTILRGKMDGLFERKGLWLFETKTKSQINESNLIDVLPMDFQVLFYLWVVWKMRKETPKGVKYNVVRKVGLEQRKTESIIEYAKRCVADIRKRPEWYFLRFDVSILPEELKIFEGELQTQIKEFYDWWQEKMGHYPNPSQCETKYGRCNYLNLCANLGHSGYEKRKSVFRELEDY